ncbi:nup57-like nuclear pore protein [Grosmannia clavigera kw1407]|uniref:Nup57-like nuclear pore protein n=1 Tax=Grosmannia clavigera (strain kw1407 / UAMH 11150) TaxID=655863 RepID=F0XK96_GROCL|nr:nup57-like nuclear pore protein [Grosmannia clavigera kw1407]EFX02011.1 nup57-like nuclear pore protein [Grosmannia clavigera kw1407]
MSLFGAKPTTGLFGSSTTAASPFGQPATNAQPTGGLFGTATAATAPTGGLFGSSTATKPAGGLFGASTQATQPSGVEKPIPDQIATLMGKWRPDVPTTVFKEYFYNKVDESRVPFFQPQAFENPRDWEEALQNKPAPGYLPVLCTGFEGLATRLQLQRRTVAAFNAGLHEINTKLDSILSQHDLQTSVRALAARRRHAELSRRVLALAAKTQVLRNRGYALSGDEDDLKQKLQAIEKTMQDPALSARMEELWSRLIVLRNYADALRVEVNKRGVREEEGLGEDVEAKAKKIVEDYEKQLQHLKKEVEQIKVDFETWQKDNPQAGFAAAR